MEGLAIQDWFAIRLRREIQVVKPDIAVSSDSEKRVPKPVSPIAIFWRKNDASLFARFTTQLCRF